MRYVALAATSLALLAFGSAAEARPVAAPHGLHGFLLRADEPATTSFPRTPAFAWAPVAGAKRYEFQLATSGLFRDSGLVYTNTSLTAPVASPPLTLPWITGQPHALWARVRAVLSGSTTPWSASYGFDIVPPRAPTPLPAAPGLLRWTPTEGAAAYQVWLEDVGPPGAPGAPPPTESDPWTATTVYTNVLDERELYVSRQWTGAVHWRVRAIRIDGSESRQNSLPAVSYGPWSGTYTNEDPPVLANDQIKLLGTMSDVTSDGSSASPSQGLMPSFTWTGNLALNGKPASFYRVYVFTDAQCVNKVFTGAVVGSPAYAPRPYGGGLEAPADSSIDPVGTQLRYHRALDGTHDGFMSDGAPAIPNERLAAANTQSGTGSGTGSAPAAGATGSGSAGGSNGSTGSGSSGPGTDPASDSGTSLVSWPTDFGAQVDLWDTQWPQGGYYWTVVPVVPVVAAPALSVPKPTTVALAAPIGSKTLTVASAGDISPENEVSVGSEPNEELVTVTAVTGNVLTLGSALAQAHAIGDTVERIGPTTVASAAPSGSKTLTVARAAGISPEDEVSVGSGPNEEVVTVTAVTGNVLTLGSALAQAHAIGDTVERVTSDLEYHDLELPQEACAAGRVMRFGKASAPTTYGDGKPYLSGLSVSGRLITGQKSSSGYYGTPLVAWEPAHGATVYQVQWSKARYPFAPQGAGVMTSSTSAVVPLTPGTWWYRVRGFDYSLPSGAQAMSWSEPVKVVIARPKFAIVADKPKH